MDLRRVPIQEMRRMNRYYELVKGIVPESETGVTVEEGWKPEAGAEIVGDV